MAPRLLRLLLAVDDFPARCVLFLDYEYGEELRLVFGVNGASGCVDDPNHLGSSVSFGAMNSSTSSIA